MWSEVEYQAWAVSGTGVDPVFEVWALPGDRLWSEILQEAVKAVNWRGLGARQVLSFQAPVHFQPWLPFLGRRWHIRRSSRGQSQGSPSPLHPGSNSCLCGLGTLPVGAMCSILGKYWWESDAAVGAVALLVQSLPLLAALVPGLAAAAAEEQVRCCYPWSPAAPGGRYSRRQSYHSAACMAAKEYSGSRSNIKSVLMRS